MAPRSSTVIESPITRRGAGLRAAWVRRSVALTRLCGLALQRLFDITLAAALLLILAPVLLLRGVVARWRTGRVLARTLQVGRFRTPFERLAFADPAWGRSLPVLLNVLRGDLAFTGPRPLDPAEAQAVPIDACVRFDVRPGLVSTHTLRRRTGVAYESEHVHDRELVYNATMSRNVGLLARALPSTVLGGRETATPEPLIDFFGITIVNTTMEEAIDWIVERAGQAEPTRLCFVNPDCLNIAYTNHAYRDVLHTSARVLPDGIGIHIGCRMLGTALAANVNGTDLFPRLCQRVAGTDCSLYLLGARPGIAEAVAAAMQACYPGLRVAGTQHGYWQPGEEDAVIEAINTSGARILLVAFGVPRQELWLAQHHDRLRPPVRMGVGGLFDFYSGRIPRAPQWMREIGLEWTWRLWQEPGRMWRRYVIGNPLFLYRVWKQTRGGVK